MSLAKTPAPLRPLGLGEIIDRAATLYARNFVPLTVIALVVVLPLSIVQYIATASDATYRQILGQIEHPGKPLPASAAMPGWLYAFLALAILLGPYATVAIAAAVGRIYRGERPGWREAYATALRHWSSVLLAVFCEIALLVALVFVYAIGLSIAIFAGLTIARSSPAAGAAAVVIGAVVCLGLLLFMLLFYLAFALAFNAIGIEELPFNEAIARGFHGVFNRAEIGKASLMCLALAAAYLGLMIVGVLIAAFCAGVIHSTALNSIAQGLVTLVSTAFLAMLVAVYYFDMRLRREGSDLDADIARLHAPGSGDGMGYVPIAGEERALIDRFVARRAALAPAARTRIAAELAKRVRPRVSYDLQGLSDEDLLAGISAS